MNVNFILADTISRINVASRSRIKRVRVRHSKFTLKVLTLLQKNGIIFGFQMQPQTRYAVVYLKYYQNKPVFSSLRIVSRPGQRVYYNLPKLWQKIGADGFAGFYVVSTTKGLVTSDECLLYHRTGGEILLKVEI